MGGCCIGNCCVMNNIIGDLFRGAFGSSGGCAYHPGPSETEAHAKKIADELAVMKENIRVSSEETAQKAIDYINKSMEELFQLLESVNKRAFGGKMLNINISGVRSKNEELKKEVKHYIGNKMDERLVTTDPELSVILEERDDKKRNKNFDDFCDRIRKQAIQGLKKKIEKTVRQQEQMIRTELELRLKEVDAKMQEATKAYEEIVRIKETDESKMEQAQINYMYRYEVAEILLDRLGG